MSIERERNQEVSFVSDSDARANASYGNRGDLFLIYEVTEVVACGYICRII